MNLINKYKNLIIQIIKFGIIGLINTVIDFFIYISLTRNCEFFTKYYIIAHISSFFVANMFSFIMNKNLTFQSDNQNIIKKYLSFVSVTIISLLISGACLVVSVHYFGISDILGKILGTILGMIWNFIMYKQKVFKKNKLDKN
ncbi:MAG TPA: GtrA family protein [bacterium]|jgi:putative flippase GtrA|nr:GtrA family protein [bacterium]HOG38021.1 GtrA family protein [bacterium]